MYKYISTCRFKMLVYTDDSILEVRPQEIIESLVELDYPYLKLIEPKKKITKNKKQYKTKIKEVDNGDNR